MARPSSSSSSTGTQESLGEESPIPYRHGPLDYSPPRFCYCRNKAARWISWSDANPGRRYFTCYRRRVGGCKYWFWAEDPHPDFIQDLLRDLKNAVKGLKMQNRELRDRLRDAGIMVEQKELVRSLRAEVEANANDKKAMIEKHAMMEKELLMYQFVIKCCVMLVLVSIWMKWLFK